MVINYEENKAPLKIVMTAPAMKKQAHDAIQRRRTEARRMIEDAKDRGRIERMFAERT